jgi:hypothetical protein
MKVDTELATIEEEIRTILADGEISRDERNAKLGELVRRRRKAFQQCPALLREYAPRARNRGQSEADTVVRELLESPEFAGLALLFPVFMAALYQRESPLRGFPLPTLPAFAPAPLYQPRW